MEPKDFDVAVTWEVFEDPAEGLLFDLVELKRTGLVRQGAEDGITDEIVLSSALLPVGSQVVIMVPQP